MQELSQWRAAKAEAALKSTVLDEETAALFSTAAALATKKSGTGAPAGTDWRTNTLATDEGVGKPRERSPGPRPQPGPPRGTLIRSSGSGGGSGVGGGAGRAPEPKQAPSMTSSVGRLPQLARPAATGLAAVMHEPADNTVAGGGSGGGVRVMLHAGDDDRITAEIRVVQPAASPEGPVGGHAGSEGGKAAEEVPPPPPSWDPSPNPDLAQGASTAAGAAPKLTPVSGSLDWASIKVGPCSPI